MHKGISLRYFDHILESPIIKGSHMAKPVIYLLILFCLSNSITNGEDKKSVGKTTSFKTEVLIQQDSTHSSQENFWASQFSIWFSKIKLSGTLNGDFRWMNYSNINKMNSNSTTDLYIRMFELGIEASLLDWATATAVLNSEWIGDYLNQGDEQITADEVHFDLQDSDFPVYLVLGKRTQPFGLFDTYLITDPLTQDAYETQKVGLTLGVTGPLDLDCSINAYKGDEQMSHLFQSGLMDTNLVHRDYIQANAVNSFILSGIFSPFKNYLTLFGAYLNEPGFRQRNTTLNTGLTLHFPFHRNILIDGEYMKALNREDYLNTNKKFKEGALSVTASYQFILRHRKVRGGGNYAGRKSHIRAHPIEAALRYEYFDDDAMTKYLQLWSVKNRYSLGGRYTFFDDGKIFAYGELEMKQTRFRLPQSAAANLHKGINELYLRLGIDF
jgi:hypothetical protein